MRLMDLTSGAILVMLAPLATAAAGITVPTVAVGRNLQAFTSLKLPQPAGQGGVQVVLHSDDPSRLLLSTGPENPGSASITLKVPQGRVLSTDFCLQALGDSGTVTYSMSAEGFDPAKGTVTLAPSAILIIGPYSAPRFPTTPRGQPSRLSLVSARLNSDGKIGEEQPVAGGITVEFSITNSNSAAGSLGASKVTLAGGSSTAVTFFKPAAEGETTIKPVQPSGFTSPAERGSVIAAVAKPALAIAGDIYLGKNLQTSAAAALGEVAPPEGLKLTLTSEDSSKLVLSEREDQLGSGSITIVVPPGKQNAVYYLQSLADSGIVSYTASAEGYQSRTAKVGLERSGVMITYEESGPPEEGNVFRKVGSHRVAEIYVSLADAKQHRVRLVAWTAYIDRATGRAADFTVQPLRPGISAKVVLSSSDAAVATIESPLIIQSGTNRAFGQLVPMSKGKTIISIQTPAGFAMPENATFIPAFVTD